MNSILNAILPFFLCCSMGQCPPAPGANQAACCPPACCAPACCPAPCCEEPCPPCCEPCPPGCCGR